MKKKILILLIFILTLIPFSGILYASGDTAIHSINIDVNLQEDGSAIVTQYWDVEKYEGTEFFIVQGNFRNGEVISNFTVTDENGTVFSDMGNNWNVDGNIDEKAFKSGINETHDGLELCWGVGDYGAHTYTIQYVMTNVVNGYTDFDGFNMRFINDELSHPPEAFSMTIRREGVEFTSENAGVWNFGNGGLAEFKDGNIVINSVEALNYSDHLTVMTRYEKGIFNPVNNYDDSFNVIKDRALEDSDYLIDEDEFYESDGTGGYGYESDYDTGSDDSSYNGGGFRFLGIFGMLAPVIGFGLIASLLSGGLRHGSKVDVGGKVYGSKPENYSISMKSIDKDEYYESPPVNSYLPAIFYAYNIGDKPLSESDLIAAYLLKWINEKRLVVEKITETKDRFLLPDKVIEETRLRLKEASDIEDPVERELWSMLVEASGADRVLQEKEFTRWSSENSRTMTTWIDKVVAEGFRYFLKQGYLVGTKNKSSYTVVEITPDGIDAIRSIHGFKVFLTEYTIINERAVQEVELWDSYLILATLYGIGETVLKELNELYPGYVFAGDYVGADMNTYLMYRMMTSYARSSYGAYRASTDSSDFSRSSGGGGFGSFGGGGGFSGGGSGGGSR